MSRGSLPPDQGSVDIEMFAPPTRMVTPSSANQLVSSSGPPMVMQLDAVLVTSRLTKEQTEEIFLLTHEVQALCGKLALDCIQLSQQEALFHMGVQATQVQKGYLGASRSRHQHITHQSSPRGKEYLMRSWMRLLSTSGKQVAHGLVRHQFPTLQSCSGVPE